MKNTILAFIKELKTPFASVLVSLVWSHTVMAIPAQPAENYTSATRYNFNRQVTGTIAPRAGGSSGYLAVRYTYNSRGLLMSVEHGTLGSWQSDTIDPADWGGFNVNRTIRYTYTSKGWQETVKTTDASGADHTATHYNYDVHGRVNCRAQRMDPYFDPSTTSACEPEHTIFGEDRITRYTYDERDRVLKEERAVGTSFEQVYRENVYDSGGHLTHTTDANGNLSHMVYDSHKRLKTWYFPSKSSVGSYNSNDYEAYTYDKNGNRLSLRKRDERVIHYQYDNLNRMIKKDIPGTTASDVYYDYDSLGLEKHTRFESDTGLGITREFDGHGRLISESNNTTNTAYTVRYQHDKNGNRTRVTYPGGFYTQYGYDGMNRVTSLTLPNGSGVFGIGYDSFGRLDELSRSNNANTHFDYDPVSRLSKIEDDFTGSDHDNAYTYQYSAASQVIELKIENARYHHTHQAKDNIGNYLVNGLNQYTSVAGKAFDYDANGNLRSNGVTNYAYDVENRLTRADGADNASLTYDPAGRLVRLTTTSNTTIFVYDGDALIAEHTGGNSKYYVHSVGMDKPIAEYRGTPSAASLTYLHRNHQGSIIAGSNASGSNSYINKYTAFGVSESSNQGRFGYTGQIYLPELSLYYYKARVYAPKLGRFLQTDPVGYEDQMNLYAYVGNDPVNHNDPTGMFTSGGVLPNPAMYELYGVAGGTEYANMINTSQALGGAAGIACVVACVPTATAAANAYRSYRYEKRLDQVRKKLQGWDESPNKKKEGSRFQDPEDKGNRVRVDKGDPNHKFPTQKVDHVVEQRRGKTVDKDGSEIKPTPENPQPSRTQEAHIPLIEWLKNR